MSITLWKPEIYRKEVAVSNKLVPIKPVSQTSSMAEVTTSYRPKSIRNRCEIKRLGGVFVLSLCVFFFNFLLVWGLNRTGSNLFLFPFKGARESASTLYYWQNKKKRKQFIHRIGKLIVCFKVVFMHVYYCYFGILIRFVLSIWYEFCFFSRMQV